MNSRRTKSEAKEWERRWLKKMRERGRERVGEERRVVFSLLDGKNKSRMGLLLCYIRDPERWTENRARKEARNTLNRSMMNTIGARFSIRKQLVLGVCVSVCVCACVCLCVSVT